MPDNSVRGSSRLCKIWKWFTNPLRNLSATTSEIAQDHNITRSDSNEAMLNVDHLYAFSKSCESAILELYHPNVTRSQQFTSPEQFSSSVNEDFEALLQVPFFPVAESIKNILHQIFSPEFLHHLRTNPESLDGKIIYLPKIFVPKQQYLLARFAFKQDSVLPVVLNQNIINVINYFIRTGEKKRIFTIEGVKGIGKSFALYVLVCYILSCKEYSVCYLQCPLPDVHMNSDDIGIFFKYFYSHNFERLERIYGLIDFTTIFAGKKKSFDINGIRFYFVLDQINSLVENEANHYFTKSLFNANANLRIIISGSSNNETDWRTITRKIYIPFTARIYLNPHLSFKVACEFMSVTFDLLNIPKRKIIRSTIDYLFNVCFKVCSGVPHTMSLFIECFLENASAKGIYDENAEEFRIEHSDIINFAGSFNTDLTIQIERDLHRFYIKPKVPFVFPKKIKDSINAIIYCNPIAIKDCCFDKNHFFFEKIPIDLKSDTFSSTEYCYIHPVFYQAREYLIQQYLPKNMSDIDLKIGDICHLPCLSSSAFGKILEVYAWTFSSINKKFRISNSTIIRIDEVVLFNTENISCFDRNVLYVPLFEGYPLYDFILLEGNTSNGNINVYFIQFTVRSDFLTKITAINNSYNARKSKTLDPYIPNPVNHWLPLLKKSNRPVKFYEIFMYFGNPSSDNNFNMTTFKSTSSLDPNFMEKFQNLKIFLEGSDSKTHASKPKTLSAQVTPTMLLRSQGIMHAKKKKSSPGKSTK